jgi:hypothetical protein
MKKIICVLGLLFIGCEDPIDVKLPKVENKLVIDAMLWRNIGETSGTLKVIISRTTDYFNDEVPLVSNATVSLELSDMLYMAQEVLPGHYNLYNIDMNKTDNFTIHLTVDNNTYTATESLVLSTRLDSVIQGENTLISGDQVEAIVTLTDRPETGNYYLIDFGYNNLFVTRDEFYNGNQISFSFFYDKYFPKNNPTPIYLMGVDKDYYTYMQILISHAGQDGGGPFATANSTLRGNIQNTTNNNDFPLGYFRVVERDSVIFTAVGK